ncbi:MAG: CoB--CoM heterodisulfide reductase iron-sulfur subunit B family protein [Chloroflexi bacterium]|nr:CoB--CoM heterodisulfide reductase iron-sulfur subunit B family protein [Chloroflexota bacterium]
MSNVYQYLPGCSLHGTARDYAVSFEKVARHLDLELTELQGWNCCGATAARSLNEFLPLVLSARNLAIAEKGAGALLAPCSMCYNNLATAQHALRDDALRKRVNSTLRRLDLSYSGEISVTHPLEILMREIGLEGIATKVQRPLDGLKVVSYYGCLLTRPRHISIPESDCNPVWLDRLAETVGAVALPFSSKTRCCGGSLQLTHPDSAMVAAKRLLDEARELEAECILVACPLCHLSLQGKQRTIENRLRTRYGINVLYFTQLLERAFGGNQW